jgi:hypothetical protein
MLFVLWGALIVFNNKSDLLCVRIGGNRKAKIKRNLDLDAVEPKAAVPYPKTLHRKQQFYDNLGGSR